MISSSIVDFIRDIYKTNEEIPLHAPILRGNEKNYAIETIESTFVSSIGKFVQRFEEDIQNYTGTTKAVATTNGTSALHTSLVLAEVGIDDLVITQAFTFIAPCNAIRQSGADPVFVDISKETLGMCPISLEKYLDENTEFNSLGYTQHKSTKQPIKAVLAMHSFGHPVHLDEISSICQKYKIDLIEDCAESLGSFYNGLHTGNHGRFSCLSFNGNKIVTTGGGGMVLCKNKVDSDLAKHITTTAKKDHAFEFFHDKQAFNYRMPNINAALGCAQLESIDLFIKNKRNLAEKYKKFFESSEITFFSEPDHAKSNYWLNSIILEDKEARDELLLKTNAEGVMTRPAWQLMTKLPMYKDCMKADLENSIWYADRLVNIPSSVTPSVE